ncbi:MAG: hypothetical protein M3004_00130 [Bacteroidota bacterium]|nr:hypothetical protein [Bacteroidota bacterium]
MSNYWNIPGIPHKGWILMDVIDVREEGQSEWETDYETCMMCGNERIRYIHLVEHKEVAEEFRVGCICAERMTNDYVNPKHREKKLRNKSVRRTNWIQKEWKVSRKGSYYFKKDEHILTIFLDKKSNDYKCVIDKTFGTKLYKTLSEAKAHLFNKIEDMREKGQW